MASVPDAGEAVTVYVPAGLNASVKLTNVFTSAMPLSRLASLVDFWAIPDVTEDTTSTTLKVGF